LVAKELDMAALDLDDLRWEYWSEIGYDADHARDIKQRYGVGAMAEYWKPFEVHGVERVLADRPRGHVIAFGGGQSVYEDADQFERVRHALRPFPCVVLLLPCQDPAEALEILTARLRDDRSADDSGAAEQFRAINRTFIEHPSNGRLATHTVFTAGRTPEQSSAEIAALVRTNSRIG
jgi:hypothetical protein